MGNVFYVILTGLWPFENVKKEKTAQKMIQEGKRPEISETILNSTDPFDRAMLKAIEMCWIQDPDQRATARQVQKFLQGELEKLGVEKSS